MKIKFVPSSRICAFLTLALGGNLHAKRILSLGNAVLGTLTGANLAVYAIGLGLAQAAKKSRKHAIKQVDRSLSNEGIDVWKLFAYWVPFVVGGRNRIVLTLDWTDFDADGHATLPSIW